MLNNVDSLIQIKASNGKKSPELFLTHPNPEVRKEALAHMDEAPSETLKELIHDPNRDVALQALHHPDLFEPHLMHALESEDPVIHTAVAMHPKMSPALLDKLLEHPRVSLEAKRLAVANHAHDYDTMAKVLQRGLMHGNEDDRQLALDALHHPNTDESDRVGFLNASNDILHKKLAAASLRSHKQILSLLNSDSVPKSVKMVLLHNPNFDTSEHWKIGDSEIRDAAKGVVHGINE